MTKKHYEAFAEAIYSTLEGITVESGSDEAKTKATEEVIYLAGQISKIFKADNSNFDYDRFTEACGIHGYKPVNWISYKERQELS